MVRLRVPGLGGWSEDPLWASVYDWSVEHPRVGGAGWRVLLGSDLGRLYAAAAEIGRQPAGSSVLDLPCGGGVALRGLRRGQGLRYVAADISEAMLGRTRDTALRRGVSGQVETRVADAGDLPFSDGEFDLVVTLTGLHCFPDPRRAVQEMVRVLRPDGVLTGSAVLRGPLRTVGLFTAGRLSGLVGPGATADELRGWLTEAGLDEVSLETSGVVGYFRGVRR